VPPLLRSGIATGGFGSVSLSFLLYGATRRPWPYSHREWKGIYQAPGVGASRCLSFGPVAILSLRFGDFTGALLVLLGAVSSLLLPATAFRRRGLAGTLLLGLAVASLAVIGWPNEAGGDSAYLTAVAIDIGLGLAGLGLLLMQFRRAGRKPPWRPGARTAFALLVVGAGILLLGALLPLPRRAWSISLATGFGVLLVGAVVVRLGRRARLAEVFGRLRLGAAEPGLRVELSGTANRSARVLLALHFGGLAVMWLSTSLHLLLGSAIVALVAGALLAGTGRGGRFRLVGSLLAAGLIGIGWYFLAHVAGDMPLDLGALRDAPYSTAFQLLLALTFGAISLALFGLWPLRGFAAGPATPLLGALLLSKLVAPVVSEGLIHWQPVFYAVIAVGACGAGLSRRNDESLIALGALGLLSGSPTAGWAGLVLVAGAVALRAQELTSLIAGKVARETVVIPLVVLTSALALAPALTGALGSQVLYSVLAVAAVIGGSWASPPGEHHV